MYKRTLKLLLTLYFLSECGNCRYVYFIGEVRKYFFFTWTLEPKEDTKYFKLRKLQLNFKFISNMKSFPEQNIGFR